jgi:acyl carrier protein
VTDDVASAVRGFLVEEVVEDPGVALTDDATLLDGLLDSWALMQLIAFLEETFDVSVQPHEVVEQHFGSIGAIAAFVDEKVAAASA